MPERVVVEDAVVPGTLFGTSARAGRANVTEDESSVAPDQAPSRPTASARLGRTPVRIQEEQQRDQGQGEERELAERGQHPGPTGTEPGSTFMP